MVGGGGAILIGVDLPLSTDTNHDTHTIPNTHHTHQSSYQHTPQPQHTPCPQQDGGDPEVEVSPRDIVYTLDAAVAAAGGEAEVLATTNLRCGGVAWCDDDLALVRLSWGRTWERGKGGGYECVLRSCHACGAVCNIVHVTIHSVCTLTYPIIHIIHTHTLTHTIHTHDQLYQSWYKTRRSIVSMIKPGDRAAPPQPLFDRYV